MRWDREMQEIAMFPKPAHITNRDLLEANRPGYCENCGEPCFPDAHHIKHRASGGPDTLDNIIYLCRECHTRAHAGLISKERLRERVRLRNRS